MCTGTDRFEQARGLRRTIAERHQRPVGLALGARPGVRRAAARRHRRGRHAVAHLHDQPLGGLAADARHARQRRHVLALHALGERAHADPGQQRQGDLRADARHLYQAAKQPPLLPGGERVQHVRILAHHQVSEQVHLGANRRQVKERRHRGLDLVAEAADLDRQLRRGLGGDPAAQRADHRRALASGAACCASSATRRACAWHTATASASAASAPGRSVSASSTRIMCATWNFSAAPEPTTASLTARAAYSNTGTPAGMAHSAAPRACPSLSALSGLRLTNTRSTATSAGACSHTSATRPSKIRRSRRVGAAAATLRQPCATTRSSWPRHSITPNPVRREPGSRPRMRTVSATATGAAVAAGSNARQDLVRYLDIRVHVPYLVQPFERLEQVHHRLASLAGELERGGGTLRHFGRGRGEAAVREHRAYGGKFQRIGQHFHRGIRARHHVLGARLERHLHELVLVRAGGKRHETHGIEQVTDRAVRAELPAVLREGAAHRGACPAAVGRHALDHHRCAARTIALVAHALQSLAGTGRRRRGVLARQRAGAALNVSPLAVSCHAYTGRATRRPPANTGGMITAKPRRRHAGRPLPSAATLPAAVETSQLCPPHVREAIAAARDALAAASPRGPADLALPAEAAEIIGALTDSAELAAALLVRALLANDALSAEAAGRIVGQAAAATAVALQRLGTLGLPRDWSPAHGLDTRQTETLRKMLLAVVSDPRLVLARLAEELVALRHARTLTAAERERRALEARAVYAPLANRLGVWQLKWELEDLAFRYLEPEEYRHVAAALNERRADRERYIEALCAELGAQLQGAGIEAQVYGRPKHIYSI